MALPRSRDNTAATRVLYAWELGDNAGHVTRAQLLGSHLRHGGVPFLACVRNTSLACTTLFENQIHFVQAPVHMRPLSRPYRHPISSYAGILAASGYDDKKELLGLLEAWISLISLYNADAVYIDHAPTALLATRILRRKAIAIGSGFEIPPATSPFPTFFSTKMDKTTLATERFVLENVNSCMVRFGAPTISSIGEIFEQVPTFLTTYPDLDHYHPRDGANYVGTLGSPKYQTKEAWWGDKKPRVLAYMTGRSKLREQILKALAMSDIEAICVFPGVSLSASYPSQIRIFDSLIDLSELLPNACAMLTDGGSGMINECLSNGIPMILLPNSLEQQIGSYRAHATGAAIIIGNEAGAPEIFSALGKVLCDEGGFRSSARHFQSKYKHIRHSEAVLKIASAI